MMGRTPPKEYYECIRNVKEWCKKDCKVNMICYWTDEEGIQLCYEECVSRCADVICSHLYHVYDLPLGE